MSGYDWLRLVGGCLGDWSKSDTSGLLAWVQINLNGYNRANGHGDEQKQDKRGRSWMRRTYFTTFTYNEKTQEVDRGGHDDQRRSFGQIEGKEETRGAIIDVYKQG